MNLTIFFFILYVLVLIIVGVVTSRNTNEEGFMIAERKVKGPQLAATFSATFFDGSVLSIYVAYVYQYGLSAGGGRRGCRRGIMVR